MVYEDVAHWQELVNAERNWYLSGSGFDPVTRFCECGKRRRVISVLAESRSAFQE
jgi:hypothetical protein